MFSFIPVTLTDIIDILLVAILIYQVYKLMRGTAAIRIFFSIVVLYLLWTLARALNMELLSTLLGQVLGVGVLAVFIVFQPEIRRFLLHLSSRYFDPNGKRGVFLRTLFFIRTPKVSLDIDAITNACRDMAEQKTGALILITRQSSLDIYVETGDLIDARLSSQLLKNIFFKNSPLHDGALIIENNRIKAARCTLPITENPNLPAKYGMRHRAAVGVSEQTDVFVIIVSEETGRISVAEHGAVIGMASVGKLRAKLAEMTF
ncbi:MAG: diadenylate cyclase CdaA [Bacteroidales bacterium]|nr:diadenylate cyclase CdaA [Bacteroidales bacterium]MCL2132758.1 diadenylate cyclase CdaA [Bacteroidales bacterium]